MKKITLYSIVLTALIGFSSCSKDFLETKPTSSVSPSDIFYSVDNALSALNGIHRSMYMQWEGRQSNGGLANLLLFYDYMCDDIVELSTSNGWYRDVYRWISPGMETASDVIYPWHMSYSTIANANMILTYINDAAGSESAKKEISAQALTYRAYFHLLAVQTYAKRYDWNAKPNNQMGVPLRLDPPSFDSVARNTVEEVYAQVFADLDRAIGLFNEAGIRRTSKSHLNKYTAYGIKARAALTTGQWQMAVDNARLAKEATGTRLMNTSAEFLSGNSSVSNPEWMWASYEQDDQPLYFYSFLAYMSFNFNSTNIRQCPKCANSVMYAAISGTDYRKQWWEPNPTRQNMSDLQGILPADYSLQPLMNRKFRAADRGSSIGDFVYMRLSEMYLIEAEALARLGQTAQAQSVLTTFAKTRNPQYEATASNAAELLDEILMQRRIELWGEGFRFFDHKRMNMALDRRGTNHLENFIGGIWTVPVGDNRWQWMIPRREIDANKLMKQNPL